MKEIINTLENFADDAAIEISRGDSESLVLSIELPSRGNERWTLKIKNIVHLDIGTAFILGSTKFGDLSLLPEGYIEFRNFDHGLTKDKYKVIQFTDLEFKKHHIIYLGNLTFMRVENRYYP